LSTRPIQSSAGESDTPALAPAQLRRGRGLGRLSRIEADAFWDRQSNQGLWWFAPHGFLRVSSWVSLVVSDRHVSADETTVAMVSGGNGWVRVRSGLVLATVFLVDVMVVQLAGLAGLLVFYLALTLLIGRSIPAQLRARKARARLRGLRPDGARLVHSLARDPSSPPGGGAMAMRELHAIADHNRWILVLEAANERLTQFYGGLGWRRLGAETLPSGQVLTAMERRPASLSEGPAGLIEGTV
jgi:hypothetical protein